VVYTVGLPASFFVALMRHRLAIVADQKLRELNTGDSPDTNPHFPIRTRYQELYRCAASMVAFQLFFQRLLLRRTVWCLCLPHPLAFCSLFRPSMFYWRLVLMIRKFSEVAVALMFSSKPLFQAWYVHLAASL
jgi:hypothetical protein